LGSRWPAMEVWIEDNGCRHVYGTATDILKAIVLGSHTLRQYLVNYARPLIYSTFLSYPSLALIRAAYDLLQSGGTSAMQDQLSCLVKSFFCSLRGLQGRCSASKRLLKLPVECPRSPIFAVQLENPRNLARYLQDQGFMVRAVVPPTVPSGTQRIRICLHAGNTTEELDGFVKALGAWCEAQDLVQHREVEGSSGIQSRL
jgi:8-amino-7-oxononanoate synthase